MAERQMSQDGVSTTEIRVRYVETDQMGIAHHSNYLIWCEQARTDYMRRRGVGYRDLEEGGLLLPVVDARLRYRAVARYDDLLAVRCWVREVSSRRVIFGYAVERVADARLLATVQTSLMALGPNHERTIIPENVRQALVVVPDPVRL
jgi:acyl-CoA thioester hydrolase